MYNSTASEYVGIDLGSSKLVAAYETGSIILNELGGRSTASLVSFNQKERFIGEAAVPQKSSNIKNTFTDISRILGVSYSEFKADPAAVFYNFETKEDGEDNLALLCTYKGAELRMRGEKLLAMLLRKIKESTNRDNINVCIAVPGNYTPSQKQAVEDAAKIAEVSLVKVITYAEAMCSCYLKGHPLAAGEDSRKVMFVDCGHSTFTVSIVDFQADGPHILSSACNSNLGIRFMHQKVFAHFKAEAKEKHGIDVAVPSKASLRLMGGCSKVTELLSTVTPTNVTVENLGSDKDVNFKLERANLESQCADLLQLYRDTISHAIEESSVDPSTLSSVELVGGGTRIPALKTLLAELTGGDEKFGFKIDSNAGIAFGAANFAMNQNLFDFAAAPESSETDEAKTEGDAGSGPSGEKAVGMSEEEISEAKKEAEEMAALDAEIAAIAQKRNELESFVFEMRSACDGPHKAFLDVATIKKDMEEAEDWLYSEEADDASLSDLTKQVKALQEKTMSENQEFYEKLQDEKEKMEAELAEEAKKAEAERAAEGEQDHDTRKLKFPDRLKLVMNNKKEATELFKDGNHRMAAARYNKSLTHCAKFFDLSPDQTEEVNAVKLSLNLNMAMCYIKMENWSKCVFHCDDALKIEATSTKALYRRATAYEKTKKFDLAKKDLKEAVSHAPDDKAILKLIDRVEAQIKREKAKEKKMAKKMFG